MSRLLALVCFAAVFGVPLAACAQYGVTFGPGADAHLDRVDRARASAAIMMAALAPAPPQAGHEPPPAPKPAADTSLTKDQLDKIQELLDNLRATTAAVAAAPAPPAPPAPSAPSAPPVVAAPLAPVVPAQVIALPAPPPPAASIPADIRDLIVSVGVPFLMAVAGFALKWQREHQQAMQQVGDVQKKAAANSSIDSSSIGLGAMLEKELIARGRTLASVDVNSPEVAHLGQMLMDAYPQWAPLVGLTLDIAKRKVLTGGLRQSVTPLLPPPVVPVAIVPSAEPTSTAATEIQSLRAQLAAVSTAPPPPTTTTVQEGPKSWQTL